MPPHSNFEMRNADDTHAQFIAVAAALKAICEKVEVHPDRVRQFIEAACADDRKLVARADWFKEWILGLRDATGDRT